MSDEYIKQQLDDLERRKRTPGEDMETLLEESKALLRDAVETLYKDQARELYLEIRKLSQQVDPRDALSRSQNQISSGSPDQIDEALKILEGVISNSSTQPENIEMSIQQLQEAASKNPAVKDRAIYLIETHGRGIPSATQALQSLRQAGTSPVNDQPVVPPTYVVNQNVGGSMDSIGGNPELEELLNQGRRYLHAGEYYQAISYFERVLRIDPQNAEARERRDRAEDYITRGIVPDTAVPFEARSAFGRAQSLERARKYQEAKANYERALQLAAAGAIQNWKPAADALLNIENSIVAEETLQHADKALKDDDWDKAIQEYESVLGVIPEHPEAKRKLELIKNIQLQRQRIKAQMGLTVGNLNEVAASLAEAIRSLSEINAQIPESAQSKTIRDLEVEIHARGRAVKDKLIERGKIQADQAELGESIPERKRLLMEAIRNFESASVLGGDDEGLLTEMIAQNQGMVSRLDQADRDLNEVKKLIDLNDDDMLRRCQELLTAQRDFSRDRRYRTFLQTLGQKYITRIEENISDRRFESARTWLRALRGEPFKMLGRFPELKELEAQIRQQENKRWLRWAGIIGGALIVLAIIAALTKDVWGPILNPPTATPTVTATIMIPTDTPSPTLTPTITNTPTITLTPTPEVIRASVQGPAGSSVVVMRAAPDKSASYIAEVPNGAIVEVLEAQDDLTGKAWRKVLYVNGPQSTMGWMLFEYLNIID